MTAQSPFFFFSASASATGSVAAAASAPPVRAVSATLPPAVTCSVVGAARASVLDVDDEDDEDEDGENVDGVAALAATIISCKRAYSPLRSTCGELNNNTHNKRKY